ncbi:hypothetical protein Asp14428_56850 [Actinoplanes sp. NBRC 14428]|nr:hypothetical protein Asp14428_56850 [Actinoplanes sp. NBRC 14428]
MQKKRGRPRKDDVFGGGAIVRWRLTYAAKFAFATSLLLFVLSAIVYSPFIMKGLAGERIDWESLSDVGQAYGGMSAVLAGLALCGVGSSLTLQQRQTRQDRASGERQRHLELIKLAIDHPEFLEVVDIDLFKDPRSAALMYANLSVGHWLAAWELGEIDDQELRSNLRTFFRSPLSRAWWNGVGAHWVSGANRKRRRFLSIAFEEFTEARKRAESSPLAMLREGEAPDLRRGLRCRHESRKPVLLAAAAGFGLGVVVSGLQLKGRKKIPRSPGRAR